MKAIKAEVEVVDVGQFTDPELFKTVDRLVKAIEAYCQPEHRKLMEDAILAYKNELLRPYVS